MYNEEDDEEEDEEELAAPAAGKASDEEDEDGLDAGAVARLLGVALVGLWVQSKLLAALVICALLTLCYRRRNET